MEKETRRQRGLWEGRSEEDKSTKEKSSEVAEDKKHWEANIWNQMPTQV